MLKVLNLIAATYPTERGEWEEILHLNFTNNSKPSVTIKFIATIWMHL